MTKRKLKQIFKHATGNQINEFFEVWKQYAKRFHLKDKTSENFFLAQVLQEIGSDLVSSRENLNYTPKALKSTFLRYRNNSSWAKRDGRTSNHRANQVKIGNIAYAKRLGNGNIESGDGYKFRGGGYFQLTGRSNWKEIAKVISKTIGEVITPEKMEDEINTTRMGLLSAMGFWKENKAHLAKTIDEVTAIVNRHTHSYPERKEKYLIIASYRESSRSTNV